MGVSAFKYNPAVDGLRAVAVLFVILFHSFSPLTQAGFLGVDVFFVISGFLITSLLIDERNKTGSIDFRAFYKRRMRRLMPALLCLVLLYLCLAPFAWPDAGFMAHARDGLIALFYVSDFTLLVNGTPEYLKHTWSLAVEMQYYLLWPFIFVTLLKNVSPDKAFQYLIVAYVALTLWRYASLGMFGWAMTYQRLDARLSGLVLGGALAFFIAQGRRFKYAELAAWLSIIPATGILMFGTWGSFSGLTICCTVVELAAFFIIAQTFTEEATDITNVLAHPWMVYLGRISYGLYLYHYPVIYFLRAYFPWQETFPMGFAVTLAIASLSFATVERFALSSARKNRL